MVNPAYRITTVAVPTKKTEPSPKSGFSFLLGRVRARRSGTGSPRGRRRFQLRHHLIQTREIGPTQGTQLLYQFLRCSVVFGGGGKIFLARRIIDALQILGRLVGVDVHDSLLLGLSISSYLPPATGFVTLQVPHLPVRIKYQALASLRKIGERDLRPQPTVSRTAAPDRVVAGAEWIAVHAQIAVLTRLLEPEKPREHNCVAFGVHAAVVESDVAGHAVRQEPVLS